MNSAEINTFYQFIPDEELVKIQSKIQLIKQAKMFYVYISAVKKNTQKYRIYIIERFFSTETASSFKVPRHLSFILQFS